MNVKEIILHCSATKEGKNFKAADIDAWHKAQGWKKIGYHYVIDIDGTLETGRETFENGAHCKGHNDIALGICYIGGLDSDGNPKDTRTEKLKEVIYQVVHTLIEKYDLSLNDVHTHNEFAAKACPCHSIEQFRSEYKAYYNI